MNHGQSKSLRRALIAVAAILPALAGAARADVVQFAVFENAQDAPVSGLNLSMELISTGSAVEAIFRNQSTTPAVITSIYIEGNNASYSLLTGGALVTPYSAGVNYSTGATPPNPPGSIGGFGGAWDGNLLAAKPVAPPPLNGIGPGESLAMQFDLDSSYASLVQSLSVNPPEFRIVQHVQGLSGGASVWTMSQMVPSPGAGMLGLIAIGFCAARRRR